MHAKLRLKLPEVDPRDLLLILEVLMRPFGSGQRFFQRELEPGLYVL